MNELNMIRFINIIDHLLGIGIVLSILIRIDNPMNRIKEHKNNIS